MPEAESGPVVNAPTDREAAVAAVVAKHQRVTSKPGHPCLCRKWPDRVNHAGQGWHEHLTTAILAALTSATFDPNECGNCGRCGHCDPVQNDHEWCRRCGGPNVIWSAQSPLWNFVMRGNDINGESRYSDLVCMACFVICAVEAGLPDRGWHLTLTPEPEGLIYETPSGRVWDPERFLWVESSALTPAAPAGGLSEDERAQVTAIRKRWSHGPTDRYPAYTEQRDMEDVATLLAFVDELTARSTTPTDEPLRTAIEALLPRFGSAFTFDQWDDLCIELQAALSDTKSSAGGHTPDVGADLAVGSRGVGSECAGVAPSPPAEVSIGISAEGCHWCGKEPAAGLASIGDRRYCHGDADPAPSCYECAQWAASDVGVGLVGRIPAVVKTAITTALATTDPP